ncbi:MAG: tetratricopeptide repeat protein [Melioribacteraceae bacterium]
MTKYFFITSALILIISSYSFAQNDLSLDNRFRLAQSYEEAGQLEKAEAILRELLNINSYNYSYFDALTRILIRQKKYSEASELIENRLKQTPQDINLYGLLGSVYFMSDNVTKAYETWERGLKINQSSMVALRVIANYAIENRAFDKAIEILKRGKEISDEPEIFSIDLANIYLANMRFTDAANEFCDLIIKKPEQIGNVKIRINYYSDNQNAVEQFIEAIKKKIKEKPLPALYDLLSYNYSLIGKYELAFQLLVEYEEKTNGNGNTIFSFAQNALQNKEYSAALKAFEYLIKKNTNPQMMPAIKYYYSTALEAAYNEKYNNEIDSWKSYREITIVNEDEIKKIIKSYEDVVKDYPQSSFYPQALYRIAEINFNLLNNIQKAESLYTLINLRAANTDFSILSFIQKGKIAIHQNRFENAKSLFEKVLLNSRANLNQKSEANFFIAKINFWQSNFNEAVKFLSETTKNLSSDFANDALELLSLINAIKRDSINLSKYAEADLLLFRKKFNEAAEIFKSLADNKDLFILNEFASYKLAETLLALNNLPVAIKILEDLSEKSKTGIFGDKSLFLLGRIYQYGIKDKNKSIQIYQKLLEKFPNSLYFEQAREYLNNLQTNNG